ncbi:DUF1835 domain-containing protein [uncultured Lutibacter sp.]|uniref:DUF1835 domain-containing protein n=1 Tax=uncultured Lutibacter sp. TaxID=437739 RepID=UPI0026339EB0|nr:DUF1835 domain-containing protein [uncultured Lutibacter sp.]
MSKILHIVNGDSTANILKQSTLQGDIVVWREVLCEGPLDFEVGGDKFWKKRYAYFETELGVSKLEYFDKTIKELIKLEDLLEYNEVVLWFEFDLFCQVNLMALCSYLIKSYRKDIFYYLICTGKVKGKDQLQSLSDFSELEYSVLYNSKIKISRSNLNYANECWKVYVENDLEKLNNFNFNQSNKFNYFQLAINQHLKRFPNKKGLNQIETKILELINSEILTKNQIVHSLLIWQLKETVYGFGNLQYVQYLKKLKNYIEIKDSKYYLNNFGKIVLNT